MRPTTPNTIAAQSRTSGRFRRLWPRLARLSLVLSAGLLVACGSQPAVLALIFDVPPPGQDDPGKAPVVRTPRRTPFVDPSIQAMKDYLARQAELAKRGPATNWASIYKKLPKDDEDTIDWMAALDADIIRPRGTIDAGAAEPPEEDPDVNRAGDVTLSTSGKPERLVVFSHAAHGRWLNCANCHPAIFEKKAGSAKITMDKMEEGEYCGVCHDKVAVAQPNECASCHKIKVKKKS